MAKSLIDIGFGTDVDVSREEFIESVREHTKKCLVIHTADGLIPFLKKLDFSLEQLRTLESLFFKAAYYMATLGIENQGYRRESGEYMVLGALAGGLAIQRESKTYIRGAMQ